eukprot:9108438-Alexandrium_andersonii.AAC.1
MQERRRALPGLRIEDRLRSVAERAPERSILRIRPFARTVPTPTEGLVLVGRDALAELRRPIAEGGSRKLADDPRRLLLLLALHGVGVADGPRTVLLREVFSRKANLRRRES